MYKPHPAPTRLDVPGTCGTQTGVPLRDLGVVGRGPGRRCRWLINKLQSREDPSMRASSPEPLADLTRFPG